MSGYIVAHFRKVKTTCGLEAVANHNSRALIYGDQGELIGEMPEWIVHHDQAGLNEGGPGGVSGKTVVKARNKIIQEAGLTRKPQKNASAAIEGVFSASPNSFQKTSDWKAYFEDCRSWLYQRYGQENVLQWNVHYDEKTPHLHILMVPIIRGREGNKYASARFLGGREGLRKAQDDIYHQVGRKWGLERGLEGSDARHTDQAEWKREIIRKTKEEADRILDEARRQEKDFAENRDRFLAAQKTGLQGWKMPEAKPMESAKKYIARVSPEILGKVSQAHLIIKNYKVKEKQLAADRKELDDAINRLKGRQGKKEQVEEYTKQVQRRSKERQNEGFAL